MGTKNYFKILFGFLFTILIMGSVFADVASSLSPVGGFARSESTYANIGVINTLLGDCSFTATAAEKESEILEGYDFSTIVATSATKESEALEGYDFSTTDATSATKESEALEGYDFSTIEATSAVKESKPITQLNYNYTGDQRVFTVNDGTNTYTITLDANYEDLAGLVEELNTQILTAGITATAGETDTFILTSTATGDDAVITVAGDNVAAFFTGDLTVNGSNEVERAKTFTVNDSTNTDTITLDANYEDLAGLVEELNTQILTAGITATAGETDTFILTSTATGDDAVITVAGDNVAAFFTGDLTVNGSNEVERAKTFTVNDSTNTDTITLDANYEDLEGLVEELNTQILTAGITATAGETNTFILTNNETGFETTLVLAGDNVAYFFTGDLTVNGSDEVERAKTFTVNDGTNTDTITLDADYEDLAGLVEELNTQILTAGITATAGETNTFILTNNETGFETTLVLAGDDVAAFFTGDLTINGTTDTSKKLEIKVDGGETQTTTFDGNYLDTDAFADWDAFLTAINFTSATETASDGANIKITSSSTGLDSNVVIITDGAGLFGTQFEIHGFDDSYSLSEGWNLVSPAYFIDANNSTIYDGDPTKIYKHTKDGFLTADVEDLSPIDAIFVKTNNAVSTLGMIFAEEDPDQAIVMDQKELTTGWNLISVPYIMQSNTINQAFAQLIEGSNLGLTTVYNWYNSNIITDWATGLNYDQGYWVNMNKDDWYSQPIAIVVEE